MPTVTLASAIARHLGTGPGERSFPVEGDTVRQALEAMLLQAPALRGYVLDDQGALRHHVAAFVDNVVVRDKRSLAEPVPAGGEVYLVQALSGG
ncbi:MAG: MoaD/ThiS family protein [Gemmataceae bacterium]